MTVLNGFGLFCPELCRINAENRNSPNGIEVLKYGLKMRKYEENEIK